MNASTAQPTGTWRMLPDFVIRTTGFAFAALDELRMPHSTGWGRKILAAEREQAARVAEFQADGFPKAIANAEAREERGSPVFRSLYRIRSMVERDKPISVQDQGAWEEFAGESGTIPWPARWNQLRSELDQLYLQGTAAFATEMEQARIRLWAQASEPRFQEAVFLSSPSACSNVLQRDVARGRDHTLLRPNQKIRSMERLLYAYAQRFCAKNETTSFFGPVDYGRLDPAAGSVRLQLRSGLGRRKAFASSWVVEALADRIASDPAVQPYLVPRLNPVCDLKEDGRLYFHLIDRQVRLDAETRDLLAHVDGCRTAREIAETLDRPVDRIIATLTALAGKRIVVFDFDLPAVLADPLEELAARVCALPQDVRCGWEALVRTCLDQRRRFQEAGWPERAAIFAEAERFFESATGRRARQEGGQMYADRLILYEDCQGPVEELRLGGPLEADLNRRLVPLLDFLAVGARLRQADDRAIVRAAYDQLAPRGGPIPFARLIRYLASKPDEDVAGGRLARFRNDLGRLVQSHAGEHTVQLTQAQLDDLARPYREWLAGRAGCREELLLPSPDILIAACSMPAIERGDYQIIVGEIHDDCSTSFGGFFALFHPDPDALAARLNQAIQLWPDWPHMANVISERRHKSFGPELPGVSIELSARSRRSRQDVIPLSAVQVSIQEDQPVLMANGRRLILYPGDVRSAVYGGFSLPRVTLIPVDLGTHTPRIEVDGLVYQRETWCLPAQAWQGSRGTEFDRFLHFQRLQAEHGLPDRVFARLDQKSKPVFVDLTSGPALSWLAALLTTARQVRLSEMLPGPNDLWWSSRAGRHTCEFRLAAVYTPAA